MTTTKFPNGISTSVKTDIFAEFGMPDPTKYHTFFEDFDIYYDTTNNWTETATGVSSGAIGNSDGGVLVLTNAAADNDAVFVQFNRETFKFVSGKKLWFKSRFKVSDATQSDFIIGLQITDTTPLDVTDGVFFQKDDGDANIDFYVEKNNTATSSTAISTIEDDTYIVLGFYYNGIDKIEYSVDGSIVGSSVITNLPDDEELTLSFGIQNGEAVAKVMSVDYLFVAKER